MGELACVAGSEYAESIGTWDCWWIGYAEVVADDDDLVASEYLG